MKKSLRKIFPLILLIWPYVLFIPILIEMDTEQMSSTFISLYIIFTVIIYIANIVNACVYKGQDDYYQLAFWNMLLKLVHIPFYMLIFMIGLGFLMASVVPVFVFLTPMIISILFIIDLFLMVTSSMYGVNAIIHARQQNVVSKKWGSEYMILHFIFVLDVISAIIIFVKFKKLKNKI